MHCAAKAHPLHKSYCHLCHKAFGNPTSLAQVSAIAYLTSLTLSTCKYYRCPSSIVETPPHIVFLVLAALALSLPHKVCET
jgi:hypothetical protein